MQRSKPIVAPSALSPSSSAPSARRYAASELDRSARSSKPLTAPGLKQTPRMPRMLAEKIENTFSRTSLIGGVLVFTAYALWIYSRNAADSCSITHSRCLTMSPIDTMPTS